VAPPEELAALSATRALAPDRGSILEAASTRPCWLIRIQTAMRYSGSPLTSHGLSAP